MPVKVILRRGDKVVLRDIKGRITVFAWQYDSVEEYGKYIPNYYRYIFTKSGNLKQGTYGACYLENFIIIKRITLKDLTLVYLREKYPEFFI